MANTKNTQNAQKIMNLYWLGLSRGLCPLVGFTVSGTLIKFLRVKFLGHGGNASNHEKKSVAIYCCFLQHCWEIWLPTCGFQVNSWRWSTLFQPSFLLSIGIYELAFLSVGKTSVAAYESEILEQSRSLEQSLPSLTPDCNWTLCMLSSLREKISEVSTISH